MKVPYESVDTTLVEIDFLRSELDTGLTLSRIAMQADHQNKAARNRLNAKKAYDTVIRFMPRVSLSREESREIKSKLNDLRSCLQRLGEEV